MPEKQLQDGIDPRDGEQLTLVEPTMAQQIGGLMDLVPVGQSRGGTVVEVVANYIADLKAELRRWSSGEEYAALVADKRKAWQKAAAWARKARVLPHDEPIAPEVPDQRLTLVLEVCRLERNYLEPGTSICADVFIDGAGMVHALSGEVVEVLPAGDGPLESQRLRAGLEAILDFVGRTAPRGSGQDILTTERLSWERKVRGLAKRALGEIISVQEAQDR